MKICILGNALAVHTQRWTKAYAQKGHDVYLLSIREKEIPGVKVNTVCIGTKNSKSRILTFLSYLLLLIKARKLIKKISPDIVNAYYVPTHGFIAACSGFHPFIITVWGSDIVWHKSSNMPLILKLMIQYVFKKSDLICATSQWLINQTRKFSPENKQIEKIPFGIDTEKFKPSGNEKQKDEFVIGFVKTLESKYGAEYLIKAMSYVKNKIPNAKLVLVGRGSQRQWLEQVAENEGLKNSIEFKGFIENEKIPEFLQNIDVFVNPSICQESFGVSVLEASAVQLPVIATKVGGVPEVCLHNETGILVEAKDIKSLADAIIKLAENSQLRKEMGEKGRKFVLQNYVWQNNVESMIKIMENLIS